MVQVRMRNGDMFEVACEPTGVPGLVAHPEVLDDGSADDPRSWILTIERTGEALISGLDLICLGEAAHLASMLAPLHDWESKVDPALMTEVDEIREQIISGDIVVTSDATPK